MQCQNRSGTACNWPSFPVRKLPIAQACKQIPLSYDRDDMNRCLSGADDDTIELLKRAAEEWYEHEDRIDSRRRENPASSGMESQQIMILSLFIEHERFFNQQ